MPRALPGTLQTVYAELLERCSVDQMAQEFPLGGSFYQQTLRGRNYWYFKPASKDDPGRQNKYVGPDSPELREMIERHGNAKADMKERRSMVVALQRAGLRGTDTLTGKVLSALSAAGVFRLRAVVIGSVAYQTYGGLLGHVLSARNLATDDLDIAQFPAISIGIEDSVDVPFLEVLQRVDPDFRSIPTLDSRRTTHYTLGDGRFRVDILTPNRGPDDERPVHLPAIRTDGQPIRYLDFLIYNEVKAVALHGNGVLINVPAPERYAIHKLLVSRMRIQTPESQAKAAKDLRQAGELLEILLKQRPYEIRDLWEEATERGPKWRQRLSEAVILLDQATGSPAIRENLMKLVGNDDGSGGTMSGGPGFL